MDDILRVSDSSLHAWLAFSPNRSLALQTLSQFPHSRTSVKHVRLIESSPALRAAQEKKLREWDGKGGLRLHWHDSIDDVPTADGVYTMVVAHEFFDALPFHLIEVRHPFIYIYIRLHFVALTRHGKPLICPENS
jgi:SAM-dependent MidA family methyltransferase